NSVAASVRILDLYPDQHNGADVSDWIEDDTAGSKLAILAKDAPLWEPSTDDGKDKDKAESDDDDKTITQLAALSKLDYERQREQAAKQLGIRRISILDKLVAMARRDRGDDDDDDQGKKQADVLIALARDAILFHTSARDCYADIVVEGHRE